MSALHSLLFLFYFLPVIPPLRSQSSSTCGDLVQECSGGFLTSHKQFDRETKYPRNMDCKWIIRGGAGEVIHLVVEYFNVDLSSDIVCKPGGDYLSVYDGCSDRSPKLAVMCGRKMYFPSELYSSGQSMMLSFKSNGDRYSGEGFNISYHFIDRARMSNNSWCGGQRILRGEQGVIESRGIDRFKDFMPLCEWVIERKKSKVVRLHFESFFVDCSHHDLKIFVGESGKKMLVTKYCGNVIPPNVYSNTSQSVRINIKRVWKVKSKFKISYKLIDTEPSNINKDMYSKATNVNKAIYSKATNVNKVLDSKATKTTNADKNGFETNMQHVLFGIGCFIMALATTCVVKIIVSLRQRRNNGRIRNDGQRSKQCLEI